MKPITISKTDISISDQLDGKDLLKGETIKILWGNSCVSDHMLVHVETTIEKRDPVFTLIKPTGTSFYKKNMDLVTKRAFINLCYCGSYIKVFLNQCENILCKRVN
jgi:hypothetical protein